MSHAKLHFLIFDNKKNEKYISAESENGRMSYTKLQFLKKTSNSIIFGQHPIVENYEIPEEEKNLLFFHFKFVEKLDIQDQVGSSMDIDGEK